MGQTEFITICLGIVFIFFLPFTAFLCCIAVWFYQAVKEIKETLKRESKKGNKKNEQY